jgi:hypothetical protein
MRDDLFDPAGVSRNREVEASVAVHARLPEAAGRFVFFGAK